MVVQTDPEASVRMIPLPKVPAYTNLTLGWGGGVSSRTRRLPVGRGSVQISGYGPSPHGSWPSKIGPPSLAPGPKGIQLPPPVSLSKTPPPFAPNAAYTCLCRRSLYRRKVTAEIVSSWPVLRPPLLVSQVTPSSAEAWNPDTSPPTRYL